MAGPPGDCRRWRHARVGLHGAPAEALRQALKTLSELSFWIAWMADLAPEPHVSARCRRDAATALRKAAYLLDRAA